MELRGLENLQEVRQQNLTEDSETGLRELPPPLPFSLSERCVQFTGVY